MVGLRPCGFALPAFDVFGAVFPIVEAGLESLDGVSDDGDGLIAHGHRGFCIQIVSMGCANLITTMHIVLVVNPLVECRAARFGYVDDDMGGFCPVGVINDSMNTGSDEES